MYLERVDIALTTDASGAATGFSDHAPSGLVRQIQYTPDGTNPLATGAGLTITLETSGLPLLTVSSIGTSAVRWQPRQVTHSVAGAGALYASGGVAVNDYIAIALERIKVVVASGGNVKLGVVSVWVG